MDNLVSIIIPSYNSENYIERCLNSILKQTYSQIEVIFINDGSTDKTESIFYKYSNLLNQKGYPTKYISQQNRGQAYALNEGLKLVSGEFLCWIDSDDELTTTSIKERVEYFKKNSDKKVLITSAELIDDATNHKIKTIQINNKQLSSRNLLLDYILNKDIYVTNGCYMIRFEAYRSINPHLEINTSRAGQNWQVILPLAAIYPESFGYLDRVLFKCYERKSSHSRQGDSQEELTLKRELERKKLLTSIIEEIKLDDKSHYEEAIQLSYLRKYLYIYHKFNNKVKLNETYREIKKMAKLNTKDKLYYLSLNLGLSRISETMYTILKFIAK